MIIVHATPTEMGAMYPVFESMHMVYDAKAYQQRSRMITSYLLSLFKLRGNRIPEGTGWKMRYAHMKFDVETKDMTMTFEITSLEERTKGIT